MIPALVRLTSIFAALSILLIGHGLQQTALPVQAGALLWSPATISLLGAAYFLGFILGSYRIPRWIRRVGHARVFSACAGLAAAAVLGFGFSVEPAVWITLRVVTGFSFAGLYLVIESWLNTATPNERRGSVMSLYSLVSLLALIAGQFLAGVDLTTGISIVAIAFCLAIYPIALTGVEQPETPHDVELSFQSTYRASQVAPMAAAVSGFVMGLAWSVGAVVTTERTDAGEAATDFMTYLLLGGACTLLPLGRLSDRVDRRLVVCGISLIGGLASLYACLHPISHSTSIIIAFIVGATAMPLYSLAIAHANDNADTDFLTIGGTLLVANGVGAVAAPLLYAALSGTAVHPILFFLLITTAFATNTLWTGYRLTIHPVSRTFLEPFQAVSRTTLGAVELDPRADHDAPSGATTAEHNPITTGGR